MHIRVVKVVAIHKDLLKGSEIQLFSASHASNQWIMKLLYYFNAKIDFIIRLQNLKLIFREIISENWRKFLTLLIRNDDCI